MNRGASSPFLPGREGLNSKKGTIHALAGVEVELGHGDTLSVLRHPHVHPQNPYSK
jgi:hypothetical protein